MAVFQFPYLAISVLEDFTVMVCTTPDFSVNMQSLFSLIIVSTNPLAR